MRQCRNAEERAYPKCGVVPNHPLSLVAERQQLRDEGIECASICLIGNRKEEFSASRQPICDRRAKELADVLLVKTRLTIHLQGVADREQLQCYAGQTEFQL